MTVKMYELTLTLRELGDLQHEHAVHEEVVGIPAQSVEDYVDRARAEYVADIDEKIEQGSVRRAKRKDAVRAFDASNARRAYILACIRDMTAKLISDWPAGRAAIERRKLPYH